MAWFDPQKKDEEQNLAGQPQQTSGQDSFSSSGGVSSVGASNAPGGVPQWTNIQEYLGANKTGISDQLKNTVGKQLQEEETKANSGAKNEANNFINSNKNLVGEVNWNRGAYTNLISGDSSRNWQDVYGEQDNKIKSALNQNTPTYSAYQVPESLYNYAEPFSGNRGLDYYQNTAYKTLKPGELALQKQLQVNDLEAPQLTKDYGARIKALQNMSYDQPSSSQVENASQMQKQGKEVYEKLQKDIADYQKDVNEKRYGSLYSDDLGYASRAGIPVEYSLNDLYNMNKTPVQSSGGLYDVRENQYNQILQALANTRKKYGF